jgi:hypothetical protein
VIDFAEIRLEHWVQSFGSTAYFFFGKTTPKNAL